MAKTDKRQHHWRVIGENATQTPPIQYEWCECGALRTVDLITRHPVDTFKPDKHPRCKMR